MIDRLLDDIGNWLGDVAPDEPLVGPPETPPAPLLVSSDTPPDDVIPFADEPDAPGSKLSRIDFECQNFIDAEFLCIHLTAPVLKAGAFR